MQSDMIFSTTFQGCLYIVNNYIFAPSKHMESMPVNTFIYVFLDLKQILTEY